MREKIKLVHTHDDAMKAFGINRVEMINKLVDMKIFKCGKAISLSMYSEAVWNNDKFSDEEVALLLITYVDLMKFCSKLSLSDVIDELKERKL
jgi:hypothetical protein